MGRFGRTYFDDPDDLGAYSSIIIRMFMQLEVLDFGRRHFQRANDKTSLRKAEEIKKILRKVSDLQTEGVRAFISEDLMHKLWVLKEKRKMFE